jgi:hypothetical protein
MRDTLTRIAVNLSVLAFVVLPLWFLFFWIWTGISDGFGGNDVWGTFSYNYVILLLPLLLGGVVQQLVLIVAARVLSERRMRLAAVATLVLIPLTMSLVSVPLSVFVQPPIAVCTVAALVVYAYLMRLPPAGQADSALA